MPEVDKYCTVIIAYDKGTPPSQAELQKQLESGSPKEKAEALKTLILLMLNGESFPKLLMIIIRYLINMDDHTIKRLLLLYWEVVDKLNADGNLRDEMILVCNALRNDLIHPNEYIRGCTLRLLCKMKYQGILQPLLPVIVQNLEHRHAYVRRNAVMCVYSIVKAHGSEFIPDWADHIEKLLTTETDVSTKRNAFMMLCHCEQDRALTFLVSIADQISSLGDIFQLATLELVRKVCRSNPSQKSRLMKLILALSSSPSPAVAFECASTLVSLSSSPTAINSATSSYIQLLTEQSDNNVKLIILDRLNEIKKKHPKIMQDRLMDILRALATPSNDIKRKCLDLAMDLLTPRNIEDVVSLLKKEIVKSQGGEQEKVHQEYRQMLIGAIHQCAVQFPDVAASVVHLLMDFLGDPSAASAVDVIIFVREILETYPKLRSSLLEKLRDCFPDIKAARVYRVALWILGEYSDSLEDIEGTIALVAQSLGSLPYVPAQTDPAEEKKEKAVDSTPKFTTKTVVLADGTYATQTELIPSAAAPATGGPVTTGNSLRTLMLGGEFYVASVVAICLTKCILKLLKLAPQRARQASVDVMLMLCGIVELGKSGLTPYPIDPDSNDRVVQCLRILGSPNDASKLSWVQDGRHSLARLLAEQKADRHVEKDNEDKISKQPDDLITIRQLRGRRDDADFSLEDDTDVQKATGAGQQQTDFASRLQRVHQMTGLSDPVYVETFLQVHHYDILLEMMVINRTQDTLQNLTIELATHGDLRIVDRPQPITIAAYESKLIKASIKVSSTEAGIIFGNITYDLNASSDRACVILNDIHIDIMDYIAPATCSEVAFRAMWAEFEWENKVAVNTSINNVKEFLNHIVKSTNMKCLTPASALAGECNFLAANLYAKSIFGEDALVNVSVEKQADGKIVGYIRIRSKTQGIALSLGDRITLMQKGSPSPAAA